MNLTFADFELLIENQMQFKGNEWELQIYRFGETPNFEHEYIYWVENNASLVLAIKYLQQQGYEYQINYDLRYDQPIFTTNFAGSWVNA
jgi:hypothetical protein